MPQVTFVENEHDGSKNDSDEKKDEEAVKNRDVRISGLQFCRHLARCSVRRLRQFVNAVRVHRDFDRAQFISGNRGGSHFIYVLVDAMLVMLISYLQILLELRDELRYIAIAFT